LDNPHQQECDPEDYGGPNQPYGIGKEL